MNAHLDLRNLVRLPDVAKLTGYSRNYLNNLMTKPGFPAARAVIQRTHFWARADIERWHKAHPRKPGGPKKRKRG